MPDGKYPVILPRKAVLPIPPKDSSSAFRGLHPQPTLKENRLLSYPEAVRTLVRTKGPAGCWLPSSRPSCVPVVLGPCASSDAAEQGKGTVTKQVPKLTRAWAASQPLPAQ